MTAIVVVGSLNMDFVVAVDRLPMPGETVLGRDFQMIPGGKGANQACAAAKLAGNKTQVRMVGRVGYDVFADHLKASLSAAGVDVSAVHATKSHATGVALIGVESGGQNSIIVASGANHALSVSETEAMRPVFRGARFRLVSTGIAIGYSCGRFEVGARGRRPHHSRSCSGTSAFKGNSGQCRHTYSE